jgi:hypothetical protein
LGRDEGQPQDAEASDASRQSSETRFHGYLARVVIGSAGFRVGPRCRTTTQFTCVVGGFLALSSLEVKQSLQTNRHASQPPHYPEGPSPVGEAIHGFGQSESLDDKCYDLQGDGEESNHSQDLEGSGPVCYRRIVLGILARRLARGRPVTAATPTRGQRQRCQQVTTNASSPPGGRSVGAWPANSECRYWASQFAPRAMDSSHRH